MPEFLDEFRFETARMLAEEDLKLDSSVLILIDRQIDFIWEESLIYWAQWSGSSFSFENRLLSDCFRLYLRYGLFVLPIVFNTGPIRVKKTRKKRRQRIIDQFKGTVFEFQMLRPADFTAYEFIRRNPNNPLTYAYLPFTRYEDKDRHKVYVFALRGIAKTVDSRELQKMNLLASLVGFSMSLTKDEKWEVDDILNKPDFEEARMLHTLREDGMIQGRAEGRKEGKKEMVIGIARNMLENGAEWAYITKMTGITAADLVKGVIVNEE